FMANEENSDYAYSEVYSEPQPLSVLIQQDDFPYLLDLMISLDVTFAQLKHLVWKKLSDLGLIHLMKSRQEYYFEFLDHSYFRRVTEFEESQRLSSFSRFQQTDKAGQESDPLGSIVTLSLSSANPSDLESRLIVEQLTAALCQRQPLCLASPSDPELIEMFHCASQVRRLVDSELQAETAEDRDSFVAWLRTNFPVALSNKLPPALSDSSMMCLSVRRLQQPDGGRLKQPRMSRSNFVDIVVSLGDRPNDILALLRRHPERDTLLRESDHQLIKLCGRMVFMYENRPLWAYKVVQRHIAHHRNNLEIRILEPREVHELHSASGAASTRVLEQLRHGVLQRYIAPRRNAQSCSMVGISPSLKFSVTLSRFNFDYNLLLDSAAVAAAAASAGTGDPAASPGIDEDNQPDYYLYIAPTLSDCSMCMTACLPLQPGSAAADCRNQQFDIAWRDLPRAARLSMAVVERTQHSETPIAWGNMPLFDSHGRLTMGTFSFGLWPVERAPSKQLLQTSGVFNPSGCAQSNSNNPPVALHITLGFELPNYTHYWSTFMPYTVYLSQSSVLQPPMHQSSDSIASDFSCTTATTTDADNFSIATTTTDLFDGFSANETGERPATPEQIRNDFLVEDATLAYALAAVETADQDLKLIWKCRNQVATCHPERIVKFCQAIPWRSAEAVDEAYRLLNKWQLDKVALEAGLQLLNSSCLDSRIRSIGVRIVDQKVTVEDDMLCLILMQMVECLKYEAYPDSALARYLLRKAFSNRQIGHHLYYLVKAEMLACDSSQHRLGIFLEAFLLFSPSSLLEYLGNQIGLAVRLSGLASKASRSKIEDATRQLRSGVEAQLEALSNVWSPAHPDILLCRPDLERCRVLDSKMRPLLLAWSRDDTASGITSLIFKCGDDLRQDMLILHCLRLMSFVWEQSGLDISLNLYEVVTCGDRKGFIEVVQDADTVAKIINSADEPSLSRVTAYLKKYNRTDAELVAALHRFMSSLAGYSVATYILGIGDRHCGNIMLRKNGVLFHIDFGHILGNFKSKLGIRRERVPFVLAQEFLDALTELGRLTGSVNIDAHFRDLCVRAYMAIRQRSDLLLNLFALMVKVGLDELKDTADLDYLIESLQSNASDQAAERHFNKKFDEAKAGNWSVTVNWLFYRIRRKN
ncbi:hypothetical protein BOX15_Mlig000947g5, partial [Macrostomum lignano]